MLYVNMLCMIYIGNYNPFVDRTSNRTILFDEAIIFYLSILQTMFTDFCSDNQIKYITGWAFIGFICINIAVNLVIML